MFGKGDPGYKVTSKFAAECALSLLEDPQSLPGGREYGGVLTSASGLGNVLIERLKNKKNRPLLNVDNFEDTLSLLLNERNAIYAEADITITIDKLEKAKILQAIIKSLESLK